MKRCSRPSRDEPPATAACREDLLRFRETGEFGAVFVWDSDEALAAFRESELARSIPGAYQANEARLDVELVDVRREA